MNMFRLLRQWMRRRHQGQGHTLRWNAWACVLCLLHISYEWNKWTLLYVSASEILGPIDVMTLLRKMTSKQYITFYGIFEEFCWPTKTVKNVTMSKLFKVVKLDHIFAQLFIYINNNSLDKNVSPLHLACIAFLKLQACILKLWYWHK